MSHSTDPQRPAIARSLGLALAFGIFLSILGCQAESPTSSSSPGSEPVRAEPLQKPKPELIILISIDTLRADHLGLYGHHRFTSPSLDLFALEGTVFEDASSVAPWTLPAHASMLTGLYPLGHAVVDVDTKLPEGVPTIAKLLGENGWKTAAAVNSMWLLKKTHEVTRDFDHFLFVQDVATARLPTTAITDRAISWIRDSKDSDLFLFLHYYDVHSDYASLPRFEKLMVSPYEGEADGTTWQLNVESMPDAFIEDCHTNFEEEKCRFGSGEAAQSVDSSTRKNKFEADDIRHLEELYDAGIRQIDTELDRLFKSLRDHGLLDIARIIITSDHGEEFSDHGSFYHFATAYQEVLHVPLILRGQGIAAGRRIEAPVSLVDIAPHDPRLGGCERTIRNRRSRPHAPADPGALRKPCRVTSRVFGQSICRRKMPRGACPGTSPDRSRRIRSIPALAARLGRGVLSGRVYSSIRYPRARRRSTSSGSSSIRLFCPGSSANSAFRLAMAERRVWVISGC